MSDDFLENYAKWRAKMTEISFKRLFRERVEKWGLWTYDDLLDTMLYIKQIPTKRGVK